MKKAGLQYVWRWDKWLIALAQSWLDIAWRSVKPEASGGVSPTSCPVTVFALKVDFSPLKSKCHLPPYCPLSDPWWCSAKGFVKQLKSFSLMDILDNCFFWKSKVLACIFTCQDCFEKLKWELPSRETQLQDLGTVTSLPVDKIKDFKIAAKIKVANNSMKTLLEAK